IIDKRLEIQERQVLTSPAVDDDCQSSAVRGYVRCERTDTIGESFQTGFFQVVLVNILIEIGVVGVLCLTEIDAPVIRAPRNDAIADFSPEIGNLCTIAVPNDDGRVRVP